MNRTAYDLVIEDCSLLSPDYTIKTHQDIAFTGTQIALIQSHTDQRLTATEYLDGSRSLAMPGLIDAHTHISQQLMRGVLTNEFPVLYLRFNLPFETRLTAKEMTVSSELAALEMIRSGITAFADAGADYIEEILPHPESFRSEGSADTPLFRYRRASACRLAEQDRRKH